MVEIRSVKGILFGLLSGLAVGLSSPAEADYPERQIRFVVPYSAGGGTDIVARLVAQKLGETLKQPVIVENKVGADGMLGIEAVVGAKPDGYTILVTTAAVAINPSIHRKARYDPMKDLQPIAQLVSLPFVLVMNPQVPVNTLPELVEYMKRVGKKANFATGGTTTTLAAELFRLVAGVDFTLIPYKGSSPAILSVVTGETQFYISDIPSAAGQVSSGALRAVAVTGDSRLPSMPAIPTAKEAGLPQYHVASWFAAFAPAGTALDLVEKLNLEMGRIVQQPVTAAKIASLGAVPALRSVGEFTAFFRSEVARWRDVVAQSGMRVED